MKKNNLLIFLVATALLMPTMAFAVEAEAQKTAEKTLATQNTPSTELSRDETDDSKKASVVTSDAALVPIASVSDVEKKKDVIPSGEVETVRTKAVVAKVSSATHAEKSSEVRKKTGTSASLDSAEMQKRWKALFSKEIDPDSMAYTVKSGDSLYVLARKNHTTVDLIKKINNLKSDNLYPKMKLKIHTASFSIEVDKARNVLVLYSNGVPVKKYSVATGKKNCTPVGEFKITDKLVHPTWFKTGAILPPGSPENALGTRWMGFDKPAYGIHGTIEPKSIGTQASEGCIRMLNEEVEELYSIVPVGTKVTIQDSFKENP